LSDVTPQARNVTNPERLERLRALEVLDTPSEAAFDAIAQLAGRLLNVPVALVSFVDDERQFFKSCVGTIPEPWMSERQTPLTHSFCQHVVERSEPLVVEDARTHPIVRDNRAIDDLGVIAYAGMPIVTPDGFVLGSLCAVDGVPRQWTEDELSSLSLLAESINTEIALRTRLQGEVRLRQEIDVARAAAERANSAKDRLLASVSHELRTPLSGVVGFAELLDDDRLDEEQRSFLEILRTSADRLLHLVDSLLRFVDLQSSTTVSAAAPFDPRRLIESAVRDVSEEAATKGLEIAAHVDEAVPQTVVAHAEGLRAVLDELVSNALAFTDRGRIDVDARMEAAPDSGPRLEVRVVDTGVGISEERLEEIFAPFSGLVHRADRGVGGLGLGLAIAALGVEAMGGTMEVESEEGEGSTFSISVPFELG